MKERYDVHRYQHKIDAVLDLLFILDGEVEGFLEKFEDVDERCYRGSSHRTRHYVSKDRDNLYPKYSQHLTGEFSRQVGSLWIATNVGLKEMHTIIREACDAADIRMSPFSELKL